MAQEIQAMVRMERALTTGAGVSRGEERQLRRAWEEAKGIPGVQGESIPRHGGEEREC